MILGISICCCDGFEYSPNQSFDRDSPRNLNEKNLARLLAAPADDTVTIVFIGDTQRFYDEIDDFIDTVNSFSSVDFILLAGDISDFGLLEEYEQVHQRISRIKKPYIGVIGNHDVMAKGEDTFNKMYGPLNFSFTYRNIKFIIHNTNGREFPSGTVPRMNWLNDELTRDTDDSAYFVAVSHVPPFHEDFDQSLVQPYRDLLGTQNVLLSLHGHVHKFTDGYPYNDNVRYMTCPAIGQRSFVLLRIVSGQVFHTVIAY